MAMKKSEIYSTLWKSCDSIRGKIGMDSSQYKDYILVLLFMRYVTDKYYGKVDALIEVPDGGNFHDLLKLSGDKEIGDKINKIIRKMADANGLVGVITVADFNDEDKLGKGKAKVDSLSKLIELFNEDNINFSSNYSDGDDILGDAYEYLMRNFSKESGKSKGQFYTPAEVSRIMAKIIGIDKASTSDTTVYDPTCGSGSLLLKAADEALAEITIYGQELDNATVALAKMNMIMHNNPMADIKQGDTLSSPEFKDIEDTRLKTFDYAVANPPFSLKSWSEGLDPENDIFSRFDGYKSPPDKNGDYAFLLHLIKSLKQRTGKGAIVLPHGVLFRGNAEAQIRKELIKKGYIKGIIGLPANLFYGTGIPACIIVIDKENAESRAGIFFIDASKGFTKDGNKNRLRERDVHKVVTVFNKLKQIKGYSRMATFEDIERNDYNLNIPRYIENIETQDMQDVNAHLFGGIPKADIEKLSKFWDAYPSLKNVIFKESERQEYYDIVIDTDDINDVIFTHDEFVKYSKEIKSLLNNWIEKKSPLFRAISNGTRPKELAENLSEDLLIAFKDKVLIEDYAMYQHFMSYWFEIMRDDVYMIIENGYVAGEYDKDEFLPNEELIPKDIVIKKYFEKEKKEISYIESDKDEAIRIKDEFIEENEGEEDVFSEARSTKGTITKSALNARIKKIKKKPQFKEELVILQNLLKLIDDASKLDRKLKKSIKELNQKVIDKYIILTEEEVKDLVVDDKWLKYFKDVLNEELEKVSYTLSNRIKELQDRYGTTLNELYEETNLYTSKVDEHLKRMGFLC
jgi:type I restriction enzyme M protein